MIGTMRKVVVVSAARTAIGKFGGQWATMDEAQLGAEAIRAAIARAGIAFEEVDEVVMGNIHGAHGNIARMSALLAGCPVETSAYTVDRQCGSGSQAIANAALDIACGFNEIVVGCGVEQMTRSPYQMERPTAAYANNPPKFVTKYYAPVDHFEPITMPQTADKLAAMKGVTREDCDAFAFQSHQRAARAIREGVFKEQIVPVEVKTKKGIITVDTDECVRYDASLETMSKLKSLYGGVTTAGNSCPRSDGAAALVLMSEELAEKKGLEPLAYVSAMAAAGCDPTIMGYGPVPAVTKLFRKTGLTMDDIDCVELNEAFAGQSIPCIRDLHMDPERVNPNGGAIAMGHPLGGTGPLLATKLLYEMKAKHYKRGIVTMCCGGGQGYAVLYERP